MPTYEYECLKCGRIFEIRQRISEPPLTVCDACGGQVRRLLSATPFILKGGGWYVTDYPSESRKKALESEKSSGKPADKPADKPAEKSADTTSSSSSTTPPSTTPPSTTPPKSD
jgi:putative FmdB family regulatory protein